VLPYIIAGITTGSVYALAAVGLILTYKTSRIFNFAHGALATCAAYLFYALWVQGSVPWPLAVGLCVLVAGPILGVTLELIGRSVSGSSLVAQVVSTVGVLLVIQSIFVAVYGLTDTRKVPQFLPTSTFTIGSTPVSVSDVIVMVVGLVATSGLWVFFRRARTGVAMRAVVDNPQLLDLAGTSPTRVRRLAWMIGVAFACVSGVLLAPLISLNSTNLTLLVVQAFGAAAIGRFSSLPMTYIGGLVIGVLASFSTKYFDSGLLANLPPTLPFVFLFLLLLFARRQRAAGGVLRPPHQSAWRAPWQLQSGAGVVLLVLLVLVPDQVGFHLTDWTTFLASTIVFLSLGLLVRTSGQVSLAHVAFVAIGASTFAHLTSGQHWPWGIALLISGLIAMPIGALLSIPAIRLSGLYLALTTLGFSIVVAYMFYSEDFMFGSSGTPQTVPRPGVLNLTSDKNYYYLVLACTVVACLAVVALNRSRLGRLLRALADSPLGLSTGGTAINITRVMVFCVSTFLAAVGGALAGGAQQIVSADSYPPLLSLTYFAIVVISAGSEPWYALLAGAGLTLIPSYFPGADTTTYLTLAFGVFAVLYAITPDRARGVPARVANLIDSVFRRRIVRHDTSTAAAEPSHSVPATMTVDDLQMQFGGVLAADGVTLHVETGKIVGLIGPNGAGKTTTFNIISGLLRPTGGHVRLDGRDLQRRGVSARARLGVGRTFQHLELYDSLSVRRNVELGREAAMAGPNPLQHLVGSRSTSRTVAAAANQALERCGITRLAERQAGSLSTGQRRLVELARCLAGPFRLLLLDEPSSGLDRAETEQFGKILKAAVRDLGLGILLVEHDMSLVTTVCDYIYVLDFGKPVFDGPPAQVLASPLVRSAYLGSEEVAAALEDVPAVPVAGSAPLALSDSRDSVS